MEKAQQVQLVKNIMKDATESIIKNIEKNTLENWDGIELRQYCNDYMLNYLFPDLLKRKTKRYKDYRNDVIIYNM